MNDNTISIINNLDCLIIDNFKDDIDQKLFYSLLNHSKQLENFILINILSLLIIIHIV